MSRERRRPHSHVKRETRHLLATAHPGRAHPGRAHPGRCHPPTIRVLSRDFVVGFVVLSIVRTPIRHGARTFIQGAR
eukprot:7592647-Pyramimonas_sp.AAC.1